MMMKYDLGKDPGRWRPGAIWLEDDAGRSVYEAPDRGDVEPLMDEMLSQANASDDHVLVRAAMAHLNLVLIHPFSDGNGGWHGASSPSSSPPTASSRPSSPASREHLGRNTAAYYAALTEVADGRWSPTRSARPWIEFGLRAHYRQAQTLFRRVRETEALWDRCEQLVADRRLPPRSVAALCDAAKGWRLHRSLYVKLVAAATGETITQASATRDLRALVDADVLAPQGERRGRTYAPTDDLRRVWNAIRDLRPERRVDDPYVTFGQPSHQA